MQEQVPPSQQPSQEMRELKQEPCFDWPSLPANEYYVRMGALYAAVTAFVAFPISISTYSALPAELPQALLAAALGGAVAVLLFLLRLRVGWGYVSSRLTDRFTYCTRRVARTRPSPHQPHQAPDPSHRPCRIQMKRRAGAM